MDMMILEDIYGWQHRLHNRFWSKVDLENRSGDDCWLWRGAKNTLGYGHFVITRNGKHEYPNASRIAYLLEHGEIDDSLNVLHSCDNPLCVNPSHLFLGTDRENIIDSCNKGRWDHKEFPQQRGQLNQRAKLSDNDAFIIKVREFFGEKQTWLAAEYGVQSPAIWKLCHGRCWNHLQF
jgi:hypothetical protein